MPRLSRKLRVCKWAGTLGCMLIVAAFIWSIWWEADYVWLTKLPPDRIGLDAADKNWGTLVCGEIRYLKMYNDDHLVYLGWLLSPVKGSRQEVISELFCRPRIDRSDREISIRIPLWLPFLILIIPTLLLWRRDRRKPRPGFCRGCDYDLTGNTTGRCPECGLDIPKPLASIAAEPAASDTPR